MKQGHPRINQEQPSSTRDQIAYLTFTSDELTELAYHLAAGDALLGTKTRLLNRAIEAMAHSGIKPPSDL